MARAVGQHHGDVPGALIEAALGLIEEGTEPSLRAVARRADVSPAAAYHHFAGKDDLLTEVAHQGFVALAATQADVAGADADRLEAITAAYVRFGWAHPTHYRLMFAMPPHQRTGTTAAALQEVALGTFATLAASIAEANPTLNAEEAARRALMTWSLAHGVVQMGPWEGLPSGPADADALAAAAGRAARAIALDPV
ncbi:MAG: TetR/AcrR family transcriptional regulator [Acidimicrobiales bacterium]|jgi:AcrR family transcriptional regulator|nr:TetR/AcrR family transcriptional regulator [Acidimicrobiales bacterium]